MEAVKVMEAYGDFTTVTAWAGMDYKLCFYLKAKEGYSIYDYCEYTLNGDESYLIHDDDDSYVQTYYIYTIEADPNNPVKPPHETGDHDLVLEFLENNMIKATVSDRDNINTHGFVLSKTKKVTLETPGRVCITFTDFADDDSFTLDRSELPDYYIRAFIIYENGDIVYSD